MTLVGTLPTAGSVSGCGLVNSNDGRTIFLNSAGGTGHFYRLDTWSDTLTEDTSYGPIGIDLHGLAVTANEKTAYITARGVADEIKVLNLNGTDVSTILIDPRPGMADRPDSLGAQGQQPVRHGALLGPGRPDQTPDGQRGVHRCRATRHNRLCRSRDRRSTLTDVNPWSLRVRSRLRASNAGCGRTKQSRLRLPFPLQGLWCRRDDRLRKTVRPSSANGTKYGRPEAYLCSRLESASGTAGPRQALVSGSPPGPCSTAGCSAAGPYETWPWRSGCRSPKCHRSALLIKSP